MCKARTEHCTYSRCKYGEEDTCTVYLGIREPSYPAKGDNKPSKEEFELRQQEADERLEV